MAFITVGINTDRVYNKKNPPGGKCTDLFGGPPDEISANPKKLNRLRSSVDLGGSEDSSEAAPRQKKSQPSVCPLTGEKIGVREESKPESKPANPTTNGTNGTSGTNGTLVREGGEATPPASAPAPTEGKPEAAPAPAPAAEPVTAPETAPAPPAAAPASDAPPAPEPTVSESATVATPVPAPAPVAELVPASAPAPVSTPALSPAPASTPAPVTSTPASSTAPAPARRRNPPGGHSAGFW